MEQEIEELRREYVAQLEKAEDEVREAYGAGSFGCHEALHMASFLMQAVDNELMSHPTVVTRPEWFALANQAFTALNELYQSIGRVHLAMIEDDPSDTPAAPKE